MKTVIILVGAFLLLAPLALGAAQAKKESPPAVERKVEKAYWITNSSGVRHNSKCRYFENSKGRRGTQAEGRACKICGG